MPLNFLDPLELQAIDDDDDDGCSFAQSLWLYLFANLTSWNQSFAILVGDFRLSCFFSLHSQFELGVCRNKKKNGNIFSTCHKKEAQSDLRAHIFYFHILLESGPFGDPSYFNPQPRVLSHQPDSSSSERGTINSLRSSKLNQGRRRGQ